MYFVLPLYVPCASPVAITYSVSQPDRTIVREVGGSGESGELPIGVTTAIISAGLSRSSYNMSPSHGIENSIPHFIDREFYLPHRHIFVDNNHWIEHMDIPNGSDQQANASMDVDHSTSHPSPASAGPQANLSPPSAGPQANSSTSNAGPQANTGNTLGDPQVQGSIAYTISQIATHAARDLVNDALGDVEHRISNAIAQNRQSLVRELEPKLQQLTTLVTTDEEDIDMGSSDGGLTPPGSPSKRHPALTAALHQYLLDKKVLCPQKNGLPVMAMLPQCAPASDVEAYSRNIRGPDLDKPLYDWSASLIKSPWNIAVTTLLAQDYLGMLQAGKIKRNNARVPHTGVTEEMLCQTIPKRLDRTRDAWREVEFNRRAQEDPAVPSAPQMAEAADTNTRMRRYSRAKNLLDARQKFFDEYLPNHPMKASMQDLLKRLGHKGMNAAESEDEGEDLHRTVHLWIAPEINALLEETDKLRDNVKAASLKDPGSPSRRRKGNTHKAIKRGTPWMVNGTPTIGLPVNWYSMQWYRNLKMAEIIKIKAKKERALPALADLQSALYDLNAIPRSSQ